MTEIKKRSRHARLPNLGTVLMVEEEIRKSYAGQKNYNGAEEERIDRTELWKKLPKKVMWQTYIVILDYLESINRIEKGDDGSMNYMSDEANSLKAMDALPDLAKEITRNALTKEMLREEPKHSAKGRENGEEKSHAAPACPSYIH